MDRERPSCRAQLMTTMVLGAALVGPGCVEGQPRDDGPPSGRLATAGDSSVVAGSAAARQRLRWIQSRFVAGRAAQPVLPAGVVERFARLGGDRIEPQLPPDGSRPAARARVELPARADGVVLLEDTRTELGLELSLLGTWAAPLTVADGLALYPAATADGADLIQRVTATGVEDFVLFETAPSRAELRYRVEVSRVAGLRLVAGVLEFLDGSGAPRMRMARPYLVDGSGRWHDAAVEVAGCELDRDPRSPWRRPVTPPGRQSCQVIVSWADADLIYPAIVDPLWSLSVGMSAPRKNHSMIALPGGTIMAAGGSGMGPAPLSVDLYDPVADSWATTGSLHYPRTWSAMTLIDGPPAQVLISGGGAVVAERWSAASGQWQDTAPPLAVRQRNTATTLSDGRVLVAGGGSGNDPKSELYDPDADGWSAVDPDMAVQRAGHTAAPLPDGRVLVAAGLVDGEPVGSAEIFEPGAGWSAAANLSSARVLHTMAALPDGQVLIAGGVECAQSPCATLSLVELFDPETSTWISPGPPGSMNLSRKEHAMTVLPSGWVLVAGGHTCDLLGCIMLSSTELRDPLTGRWTQVDPLFMHRANLAAASAGGVALVSGGDSCDGGMCGVHSSAERFLPQGAGEECLLAGECATGYCVDGVCCDVPCDAPCHACTAQLKESGPDGSCGPSPAGDDPRGLCEQQDVATCGTTGVCTAQGECARYAEGAECLPAECTANLYSRFRCVEGACALETTSCAPYAFDCQLLECKSSCDGNPDCVAGSRCDETTHRCVNAAICDGDHTATTPAGVQVDCSPYRCTPDGSCLQRCSSSEDCVQEYVCRPDQTCAVAPDSTLREDVEGVCGCRLPGESSRPPHGLWWLALAALATRRGLARSSPRTARQGRVRQGAGRGASGAY